jgi:hypothetical protein
VFPKFINKDPHLPTLLEFSPLIERYTVMITPSKQLTSVSIRPSSVTVYSRAVSIDDQTDLIALCLWLDYDVFYWGCLVNCNPHLLLSEYSWQGVHKFHSPCHRGHYVLYGGPLIIVSPENGKVLVVTLLAPRILWFHLEFWKIFGPLFMKIASFGMIIM